jgi:hypothetical protein
MLSNVSQTLTLRESTERSFLEAVIVYKPRRGYLAKLFE